MFDEQVNMVIMRCTTGDMGIMAGHAAYSAVLDIGILRILDDDADERRIALFGGVARVLDNLLTILVHDAKWPDELDKAILEADPDEDDVMGLHRLKSLMHDIL